MKSPSNIKSTINEQKVNELLKLETLRDFRVIKNRSTLHHLRSLENIRNDFFISLTQNKKMLVVSRDETGRILEC